MATDTPARAARRDAVLQLLAHEPALARLGKLAVAIGGILSTLGTELVHRTVSQQIEEAATAAFAAGREHQRQYGDTPPAAASDTSDAAAADASDTAVVDASPADPRDASDPAGLPWEPAPVPAAAAAAAAALADELTP